MTDRLYVTWDKRPVGTLDRTGDTYGYDYTFTYDRTADRAVSVALPIREAPYPNAQTRPFFDALLPEGALRESLAVQFRLPLNDAFGLLDKLGRDCAGALQIAAAIRPSETPVVDWLDAESLAAEIRELPRRPLGMPPGTRTRLSLAGVQRKAVLVRGVDGRFGLPVHGAPTTHLVKPEPVDGEPARIAVNEFFCMRLAAAVGLPVAGVELMTVADQRCLVVERFDRDRAAHPVRRLHQEDLCQAMASRLR